MERGELFARTLKSLATCMRDLHVLLKHLENETLLREIDNKSGLVADINAMSKSFSELKQLIGQLNAAISQDQAERVIIRH